jgi:DNA helicase-2/ATP-dependent DNA helicase PcrA
MDPKGSVQASIPTLGADVLGTFDEWRIAARSYVKSDPNPRKPISLSKFVRHWQTRTPLLSGTKRWEVPIAQLAYTLLTWIQSMQQDIESLVHLEAVLRTITESGSFSKNEGNFRHGSKSSLSYESVKDALWHTFMPLASGAIEVNEDLYDTLAPDRFNIMSIHQAKGLEFPLVVVDVGSEFKRAHPAQAFKRFPRRPSKDCEMEDDLRPFSPLGRPTRSGLDRTFDDLVRRYFVAFSRAQDVLLLVGLDSTLSLEKPVQNVATGWTRGNEWAWKGLKNLVSI